MMRKLVALACAVLLLAPLVACGKDEEPTLRPYVPPNVTPAFIDETIVLNGSASAWYDVNAKDADTPAYDNDPQILRTSSLDGEATYSFLHFALDGSVWPDELQRATLRLKLKSSHSAKASMLTRLPFFVQPLAGNWSFAETTPAQARALVLDFKDAPLRPEQSWANGWLTLDLTDYVRQWLAGDMPNCGFALSVGIGSGPENDEPVHALVDFYSSGGDKSAHFPQLDLQVKRNHEHQEKKQLKYGKFGFAAQTEGNCLSYALRDTDMILADALKLNFDTVRRSSNVLETVATAIETYVETHKAALQITKFRRLKKYDSSINAKKEYRIALRCYYNGGNALDFDHAFDYHLWVQLNDGRWAQKFPLDPSGYLPGSFLCDPAAEPWDSSLQWGNPKFMAVFHEPAVYFAVTKSTDVFTAHTR